MEEIDPSPALPESPAAAATTASLEKSGLSIEEGELIKRQGEGVVARHSLATIEELAISRRIEPLAVVLAVGAIAGATAAKFLIPAAVWSWSVFGFLMLVALVCMLGAVGTRLRVKTAPGEVSYHLLDADDENQGFVLTLRERTEGSVAADPPGE